MLERIAQPARKPRAHRPGGQIRPAPRRLPLRGGGPAPRAAMTNGARVEIDWIDSETLDRRRTPPRRLGGADGILVPGGFGDRGIEGMVARRASTPARTASPIWASAWACRSRSSNSRATCWAIADANSTRVRPGYAPTTVIDLMPDQQGNLPKGGTMRLGAYPCELADGYRMLAEVYGTVATSRERHRHRYEFNNAYREAFAEARAWRISRHLPGRPAGGGGGAARTIPSSSACSSTPSSSPAPTRRTRSFPGSSAPRWTSSASTQRNRPFFRIDSHSKRPRFRLAFGKSEAFFCAFHPEIPAGKPVKKSQYC